MKVIDFDTAGNVIKLYYGADDIKDWHGDDWNDTPYEHNAGTVYSEFVKQSCDYAFPFGFAVLTPATDWNYQGNSPFCKDDMKARKCPCLVITSHQDFFEAYSKLCGVEESDELIKIYFGDTDNVVEQKIRKLGGLRINIACGGGH